MNQKAKNFLEKLEFVQNFPLILIFGQKSYLANIRRRHQVNSVSCAAMVLWQLSLDFLLNLILKGLSHHDHDGIDSLLEVQDSLIGILEYGRKK